MSIQTGFAFLNANDPRYLKAIATPEGKEEWEDDNGSVDNRPGAVVEGIEKIVEDTDEEYGGWIIPVDKIPENVTHIVVYRS